MLNVNTHMKYTKASLVSILKYFYRDEFIVVFLDSNTHDRCTEALLSIVLSKEMIIYCFEIKYIHH